MIFDETGADDLSSAKTGHAAPRSSRHHRIVVTGQHVSLCSAAGQVFRLRDRHWLGAEQASHQWRGAAS